MCPIAITCDHVVFIITFFCSRSVSPWLAYPNISAHRAHELDKNTHEMPPKKRLVKQLPVEDSSRPVGGQDLTTTDSTILTTHIPQKSHPHTSTESHATITDARRPEDTTRKPSTQVEVFKTVTAAPQTFPLCHYISSNSTANTNTDKSKLKMTDIKIPRKKLKSSSRTS
jgi:hypothetical protein